jgi:protein TonB
MVVHDQLKLSSDGLCRIGEREGNPAPPGVYDPPEAAEVPPAPPRDVWSLGVTLVQSLTQLLPVWDGAGGSDLTLPEKLQPPFLEIARNCLHRDPKQRWAMDDIAASLSKIVPIRARRPVAQATVAEAPRNLAARRRYAVPALAVLLAAVALFGALRLLNIRMDQPFSAAEAQSSAMQVQEPAPRQTAAPPPATPRPPSRRAEPAAAPKALQPARDVRSNTTTRSGGAAPPVLSSPRSAAPAPSASVAAGQVLEQVLPDVPRSASNTIRGTVRVTVRVRVDPAGSVSGIELVSPGPSRYFARLSSEAARNWKFTPAKRAGQPVASAWSVRFEYTRTDTRAIPTPDGP